MAEFDKWLKTVNADAPVSKAARRALKQRVRAVQHFLKHAAGATSKSPEPVHQLRVWSRRASAAVRMFDDLLPRRKARKLKRTLRKLRRLGGAARDCDLLLQSLAADPTTPATVRLTRQLEERRKAAQKPIDRAKRKLVKRGQLKRRLGKVLDGIRWKARSGKKERKAKEPTFRNWAGEQLESLLAVFLAFDAASLQQDEKLHELRIALKKLRYAAELSVAAFPRIESDGLYDQLVQLQDRLGDAVDHLAAVKRFELLAFARDDDQPYFREAIAEQRRQFAAKKRKFLRWWTTTKRRTMESRWRGALRAGR